MSDEYASSHRRGSSEEDDLDYLMQEFGIFEDLGEEAAALENEIGRGVPSNFAQSSSSLALAASIQSRKQAANSPLQTSKKSMEIEHDVLIHPGMVPVKPASDSNTTAPVKSKRGRKKKVETLARLAASANGGDLDSKDEAERRELLLGSEEEKERLRRESNKQSARNSRKKKKEYVIVLSESISTLTKEVQQLRLDLARKSAEDEHREKLSCIGRNAFLQALDGHGPMSTKRRVSSVYQFENLTRNVAPPHTRFLLWSVARRATEADSAAARTWHEVSAVMGLQPEQQERLSTLLKSKKATDVAAAEERDKLQFVFSTIQRLRSGVDQLNYRMDAYNRALLDVLTPVQQALLYQYIEETRCESGADTIATNFALGSTGEPSHVSPELQRLHEVLTSPVASTLDKSVSQQEQMSIIESLLGLK